MGNKSGGVFFIGDEGVIMGSDENVQNPCLLPASRMKDYTQPTPSIPRSPGQHEEWIAAIEGAANPRMRCPISLFGPAHGKTSCWAMSASGPARRSNSIPRQ